MMTFVFMRKEFINKIVFILLTVESQNAGFGIVSSSAWLEKYSEVPVKVPVKATVNPFLDDIFDPFASVKQEDALTGTDVSRLCQSHVLCEFCVDEWCTGITTLLVYYGATLTHTCFCLIYTVQYSTVQYSTVQYSTVQYSTVQYSTVQYSTVQYSTVQYNTIQ